MSRHGSARRRRRDRRGRWQTDRQALYGNIMHDLIVGALQEGGIDRSERLHAFARQARREGHGVLLGNADVEGPLRKFFGEAIETCAIWHGCGDGDDLLVLSRLGDKAVGENPRVGRRFGLRLRLRACHHVELAHAVVFVVGRFGRAVTFALLGDDMDQDRPLGSVADILKHRQQLLQSCPSIGPT